MKDINYYNFIYLLFPILIVYYTYYKWNDDFKTIPYALGRMLLQLSFLAYILIYIFNASSIIYIVLPLSFMLIIASIIALRATENKNYKNYLYSFISVFLGGGLTLFIIIFLVLDLKSIYEPRYIIPLAGIIFASCMNAISLSSERFEMEYKSKNYNQARTNALKASLIPSINALFAVGLVSIPGMMSGQILSGIDVNIAIKYQIMVMLMILSSAGLSTIIYLKLIKSKVN